MSSQSYDGFVYKWTNKTNGKFYIGSHYGRTDDGYIGSGIYFRRAYKLNPEHFDRSILEFVQGSRTVLQEREQHYLDMIDNLSNRDDCYNISPQSSGGYLHGHLSDDRRREIYGTAQAAYMHYCDQLTPEEREELKSKKQTTWNKRKEQNIPRSSNISKAQKDIWNLMTEQERSEVTQKRSERFKSQPEEWHEQRSSNMSTGIKKWHDTKDPELERQRVENMRATKIALKLKCIHKDGQVKQVPSADLERWLCQGWMMGRGLKR
jgi:hypothetical protein